MTKPHNGGKNRKNGNSNDKKQNGTSQQDSTKTKAILKLKPARKPEQTIKATFTDRNDNEVKLGTKLLLLRSHDFSPRSQVKLILLVMTGKVPLYSSKVGVMITF